jgi:hypothetical protein
MDRFFYIPIVLGSRQHIFDLRALEDRRVASSPFRRYIDAALYVGKLRARANRIPRNGMSPRSSEIAKRRLLCKNVNGVVFATPLFQQMYPDATFVALVRNGLALCEGFVRRGWDAREFGILYDRVCRKMLQDAKRYPNYHIVRFEDLLRDPANIITDIYHRARLDTESVKHFRLQAKPSMDKDGQRKYTFGAGQDRERHWFTKEQLSTCLRPDVNQNQIAQLSATDKQAFLQQARHSMDALGYGDEA